MTGHAWMIYIPLYRLQLQKGILDNNNSNNIDDGQWPAAAANDAWPLSLSHSPAHISHTDTDR